MPQGETEFDSADFARLLHQNKYRLVAKKGEGTFSEVLKAQSLVSGESFAIKCMKSPFKTMDQVNSLREIQALRRLNPHPNVIDLEEVLYDPASGRLALVFELMDHNIYEMIRGRKTHVKPQIVKNLMYQLFKAVAHMHKHGIFHRDIKPENILVSTTNPSSSGGSSGSSGASAGESVQLLKVADYGSCRGIYTAAPYTEYISTRWYRAPECLLTNGYYDYKMDIWGIGSVMFEIISLFPLFPGSNELDQVEKIHSILGTPPKEILEQFRAHSSHIKNFHFPHKVGSGIARLVPHASSDAVDLMERLLAYNPEERLTARQALRHPYFRELREAEKREKIRTASPKLGATRQTMQSRGSAAAAADGGANTEEEAAAAAAAEQAASEHALPAPSIGKKKATKSSAAAAAAAAAAGESSGSHAPHKKFPSILPQAGGSNAAAASSSHHGGSGAGVSLPSMGGAAASSSSSSSHHHHAAAAAAGSSGTSMPHIGSTHASHKGAASATLSSLASSSDSLSAASSGPGDSPAPTRSKQPKGSKAHKQASAAAAAATAAAAALLAAQQLLLEKQQAVAEAAAGALLETASDSGSLRSGDGGGVESNSMDGVSGAFESLAAKERAALQRQKEKMKELALLKNGAAAHNLAGSSSGAAAVPAVAGSSVNSSKQSKSMHKQSSQHKLLPAHAAALAAAVAAGGGAPPPSYQQYSSGSGSTSSHAHMQALAANLAAAGSGGGGGGKKGSGKHHLNAAATAALLPSLSGSHGKTAGAASGHLKSSASLHALQQVALPSADEEYTFDDVEPSASVITTHHHPAPISALSSSTGKKKGAASGGRKAKQGASSLAASSSLQSSPLQQPVPPPYAAPPPPGNELLSLSGHTATLSLHASSSTSQLRGAHKKAAGKTSAAALSLALHSLAVGDSGHAQSKHRKA